MPDNGPNIDQDPSLIDRMNQACDVVNTFLDGDFDKLQEAASRLKTTEDSSAPRRVEVYEDAETNSKWLALGFVDFASVSLRQTWQSGDSLQEPLTSPIYFYLSYSGLAGRAIIEKSYEVPGMQFAINGRLIADNRLTPEEVRVCEDLADRVRPIADEAMTIRS